jgi:site-specific DNA-methyltransferase (adenine-specific)
VNTNNAFPPSEDGGIQRIKDKEEKKMANDKWETPKDLYDKLNAEFHFNCDPCPLDYKEGISPNGLKMEWGTSTFVNPPYSKPKLWINKAIEESHKGKIIVMLLKSDTSTLWYHELIVPNAERIEFIKGRLKFTGVNKRTGKPVIGIPCKYASIIVVFKGKNSSIPPTTKVVGILEATL